MLFKSTPDISFVVWFDWLDSGGMIEVIDVNSLLVTGFELNVLTIL